MTLGMSIDYSIRVGDLIQIATIAAGGLLVFAQMRYDLRSVNERLDKSSTDLAKRLDKSEAELEKQTDILTQLAAGDARMDGLDRRLTLLENAR
ncbi:hypothetical protein [Methylosinus sporium]|uniref:Uncharacterized protein n=2 Tax=Methylosinus sporium TaxID=428 RepID=A0A2U1SSU2_METSR|nr:hypothetical protein [Methylosinus sporium]PWB94643.1 hypothetical protein C5689_06160 [Methylosinus sporium]